MGTRTWFVEPETVTIQLGDGDWIEVKKQLTVGDQRTAFQAIIGEINQEGWRRPRVDMLGIAEVLAYLVDWSAKDKKGQRIKVSEDALKNLPTELFNEIEAAVTTHIAASQAALAERKNDQSTATASGATS